MGFFHNALTGGYKNPFGSFANTIKASTGVSRVQNQMSQIDRAIQPPRVPTVSAAPRVQGRPKSFKDIMR